MSPRASVLFTTSEEPVSQPTGDTHALEPTSDLGGILKAQTSLQLAKCEKEVEEDLLEASLDKYQSYLNYLDSARTHLDELLSNTASILDLFSGISTSFKAVDSQTSAFQGKTEGLVVDQRQNETIADGIRENLRYYEPLDKIGRRLNAPSAGNLVRSRDFAEILVRLDECIDYMLTHPEQKEAETYRSRYRLLLTRSLTLVRTQFVTSVRETTSEVAKRIADKQLNETTMSALLYAKFRVGAAEMKELGLEIQKRASPPVDAAPGTEGEYQSLMDELHTSFAASRGRLVIPLVRTKLAEIAQTPSTSKDLVSFARAAISYIRGICLDEFELWGEWFHGQRGLYDLLESICEPIYDHLRPRIMHEHKLPKLCQLCSLLQTRYMDSDEEEHEQPETNELNFALLVQPILEDTQSRIVFRAQTILRDEIENFKPKATDLDYPGLLNRKVPSSGHKDFQVMSPPNDFGDDHYTTQERWRISTPPTGHISTSYPSLTRAVSLLSLIYRLLNPSIFDDLAHRVVHATTLSLVHACGLLKAQTRKSSIDATANGQLFLLTHLLLLKSQIVAFDIEFSPQLEVSFDFSNLTNTFYELHAERGGLFNPINLVRLMGRGRDLLPRVVENMLDAKVELDGQLRKVISDFTSSEGEKLTKALQGKGTEKKLEQVVGALRTSVEREVPLLRRRLEEWIADFRTRETLVEAVREGLVQSYKAFVEDRGVNVRGGKGKGRDDAVWDADTFAQWTESIFGVGKVEEAAEGPNSRALSSNGSM